MSYEPYSKEREIKDNNELVSYQVAILAHAKGFVWPCINAFNSRREILDKADGIWFFDNTYMGEHSRPTKGLLAFWLKKYHNLYVDFRVKDEDFILQLEKIKISEKVKNIPETLRCDNCKNFVDEVNTCAKLQNNVEYQYEIYVEPDFFCKLFEVKNRF